MYIRCQPISASVFTPWYVTRCWSVLPLCPHSSSLNHCNYQLLYVQFLSISPHIFSLSLTHTLITKYLYPDEHFRFLLDLQFNTVHNRPVYIFFHHFFLFINYICKLVHSHQCYYFIIQLKNSWHINALIIPWYKSLIHQPILVTC